MLIAAIAALFACLPAAAAAMTTGGAPTPAGAPPAPPSGTGAPASGAPSAGTLSLISARTTPHKSFFYGMHSPSIRFEIGSSQPQNDLRIDVVGETGEAVRTFYRNDVAPQVPVSIRWDGLTAEGKPAPKGHYSFNIGSQTGTPLARPEATTSELSLGFDFYVYTFPLLGAHDYGGAAGRFGAGRDGHTHEGQDVMADCGVPVVAARGGRVRYSGYQSLAGNYVVIDGKGTPYDTAYMHLAEPSPLQTGDPVLTGQPIGIVGETGDATACHLHFELWTGPGWYVGGSPIDPLPFLKKWDAYS